jgi:hypothetical protein
MVKYPQSIPFSQGFAAEAPLHKSSFSSFSPPPGRCRQQAELKKGSLLLARFLRNNDELAYASQLNSFTHLRALLVLDDSGI